MLKIKLLSAAVLLAASTFAFGQVCDAKYIVDVNMIDAQGVERDVMGPVVTPLWGMPVADLDDNTKRGIRVVNALSKAQDKGGPYTVEVGEWRTCDGKTVQVAANSIMVKGVTLKDYNKISRLGLQIGSEVQDRYDHRGNRGDKHAWDHNKGRKTQRDDLGKRKD